MTAPTVRQALAQAGLVPIDGQVLVAHVLQRDRAWLAAHGDDVLAREQADAFFALAKRRRDGEPVAYLTGFREFWGLALAVTRDVLIPRPETETLVELALAWLPRDRPVRVLDLGTGSGAIALAIASERPRAHVVATEGSAAALAVARDNAQRLALSNVEFAQADWYDGVSDTGFDMIVSNPPYVAMGDPHLTEGDLRFEPAAALASGVDGLAALRTIITGARARLAASGALIVEHGYAQSAAVQGLLRDAGFVQITVRRDLAGIARVAGGKSP
jgi:release factor glutamine methyltransferase